MLAESTTAFLPFLEEYTGLLYRELNRNLREGRADVRLKGVLNDLYTLKAYQGKVYRGTSLKAFNLCVKDNVFEDKGFLSASKSPETAAEFTEGRRGKGVFLTIISRTGKDVSEYSKFPEEEEVIFTPGTKFRVKKNLLGFLTSSYTLEEI